MKSVLIIRNIRVENANAIAGLTYGFPAITQFLGFTHSISRKLRQKTGLSLGGCAVICHQHQVQAYQPAGWGDYVFSLTRNPLTKEGNTQPFNEEGRMHITVSLIIECDFHQSAFDFDEDKESNIKAFEHYLLELMPVHRLAGGTIKSIDGVQFFELEEDSELLERFVRKTMLKLLPGFALVDRSNLLKEHQSNHPELDQVDVWLDFSALKFKAVPQSGEQEPVIGETKARWEYMPKPASGWLVPISTGYKAISPLYENSAVSRTRDSETPFRFVESIYGIGEWLSPHRVKSFEDILWRHHAKDEWYLCVNKYPQSVSNS